MKKYLPLLLIFTAIYTQPDIAKLDAPIPYETMAEIASKSALKDLTPEERNKMEILKEKLMAIRSHAEEINQFIRENPEIFAQVNPGEALAEVKIVFYNI